MHARHKRGKAEDSLEVKGEPEGEDGEANEAADHDSEQLRSGQSARNRGGNWIRTSEKSLSFQIFISIIAYGYLISHTTNAAIKRTPRINRTST